MYGNRFVQVLGQLSHQAAFALTLFAQEQHVVAGNQRQADLRESPYRRSPKCRETAVASCQPSHKVVVDFLLDGLRLPTTFTQFTKGGRLDGGGGHGCGATDLGAAKWRVKIIALRWRFATLPCQSKLSLAHFFAGHLVNWCPISGSETRGFAATCGVSKLTVAVDGVDVVQRQQRQATIRVADTLERWRFTMRMMLLLAALLLPLACGCAQPAGGSDRAASGCETDQAESARHDVRRLCCFRAKRFRRSGRCLRHSHRHQYHILSVRLHAG